MFTKDTVQTYSGSAMQFTGECKHPAIPWSHRDRGYKLRNNREIVLATPHHDHIDQRQREYEHPLIQSSNNAKLYIILSSQVNIHYGELFAK